MIFFELKLDPKNIGGGIVRVGERNEAPYEKRIDHFTVKLVMAAIRKGGNEVRSKLNTSWNLRGRYEDRSSRNLRWRVGPVYRRRGVCEVEAPVRRGQCQNDPPEQIERLKIDLGREYCNDQ